MKQITAHQTEVTIDYTASFKVVVCGVLCPDPESNIAMEKTFPRASDFIEYWEDRGGVKAYLLAVSKRAVEILEQEGT